MTARIYIYMNSIYINIYLCMYIYMPITVYRHNKVVHVKATIYFVLITYSYSRVACMLFYIYQILIYSALPSHQEGALCVCVCANAECGCRGCMFMCLCQVPSVFRAGRYVSCLQPTFITTSKLSSHRRIAASLYLCFSLYYLYLFMHSNMCVFISGGAYPLYS